MNTAHPSAPISRNRPFTTNFPEMLDNHEQWVRETLRDTPNGEDHVKAIMQTVKPLFKSNIYGGNIMISFKENDVVCKVTHYFLIM